MGFICCKITCIYCTPVCTRRIYGNKYRHITSMEQKVGTDIFRKHYEKKWLYGNYKIYSIWQQKRLQTDKFALISKVRCKFVENSQNYYKQGPYIIIDKQKNVQCKQQMHNKGLFIFEKKWENKTFTSICEVYHYDINRTVCIIWKKCKHRQFFYKPIDNKETIRKKNYGCWNNSRK